MLLESAGIVHKISALTLLELLPYHSVGCVIVDPPSTLGVSPDLEIARTLNTDDRDLTTVHEQCRELTPIAAQVARILHPGGCVLCMGETNTVDAWEFAAQSVGLKRQGELTVLWDDRANRLTALKAWSKDKKRQNRKPRRSDVASMKMLVKWHVSPGFRGSYRPASTIATPTDILKCDRVPILERHMPTQRPVALFDKLLRVFTRDDDVVVDPFVGSGSSLVAAEYRGRKWIAGDIDAKLCKIARQRASNFMSEVRAMGEAVWWMADKAVKDIEPIKIKLTSKKGGR